MSNPPSSTKQAKQSSHLAPRDELGAWQARQNQTRLTQRRKGAKIPESLLNFAPLRLCVRQKKHLLEHGASKLATASWSAVAERRERSLASATPLSSVHRFPQTLLALAKRCRASLPTALQDAVANIWMRVACVVVSSFLMTSCLKFGEELEFFEPNVTAKHLEVIEKRTGIDLPQGSVGMVLYSNATSIDPWMLAKIKIPADKVEALRKSKPFTSPPPKSPTSITDPTRPWWKPQDLINASNGESSRGSQLLQWTLGQEKDDQMLYISWYTF